MESEKEVEFQVKKWGFVKKSVPFLLLFLLLLSIIAGVSIGSVSIKLGNSLKIILNSVGIPVSQTWSVSEEIIVTKLRFPRVLMAVVVGAMLAIAGVASQGLFKNPIADPYIMGNSSAAGFGAALIAVLEINILGIFTIPLVAFVFSLLSVLLIYNLAKTRYGISIVALLLSGVAMSYVFSALISVILYTSEDKAHLIISLLMGNFWGITWLELGIVTLIMIPASVIIYIYGLDLNILLLGDDNAQSMGVNVKQSKRIIVIATTVLTSTAVAFCGSIGFVGLIIPHAMRYIVGSDNRKLIPISALAGGLLMVWADVLARTLSAPLEIPVGIFTSIMGGPFFMYLVIHRKKTGKI